MYSTCVMSRRVVGSSGGGTKATSPRGNSGDAFRGGRRKTTVLIRSPPRWHQSCPLRAAAGRFSADKRESAASTPGDSPVTTSMHTGFARVTVVAPRARVDVSLPQSATIADLLPQLLHLVGEDPADRDAAPNEWVLTRVGDAAVDTGRTVEALGVRDGEMLYLTPRGEQPPAPVFDDVAEAVAHVAMSKEGRWEPVATRKVGLVAGLIMLLLGAGVVAGSGAGWAGSLLAFTLAILLIGVGSGLARAGGDAVAGTVLGGAALGYAFAGGLVLLTPEEGMAAAGRAQLVVACAALVMFAVIAAAAIGDFLPLFLAAATAGGIGGIAAIIAMISGAPAQGIAAATAAVVMAFTPLLPLLSLRLAGLTMPALPADATDFRRDEESLPEPGTLEQTALGDEYLAALLGAVAAVLVVCQWTLMSSHSLIAGVLAAVLALALLLRSRVYPARTQRYVLLVGSMLGGASVIVGLAFVMSPALRLLLVVTAVVAGAGIALLLGLVYSHRRPSPYWGRALDILEILVLLSIIPLALGALELYQYFRALAGG
ncbi:MAG: type VII secretion integral membrane protein EccD [Streptosporangiales bacterium]|nr:type VII secretion integral membrane protein EccD [Streptosporangiales bacterium]